MIKQKQGIADENLGLVLQAIGGICRVHTVGGPTLQCRLRGRIKLDKLRVLPGDHVRVTPLNDSEGVVEEVLPRQTLLQRPYVANVDQVVVVVALAEPPPNLDLLDRLLVAAGDLGLQALIVWNKADLVDGTVVEQYCTTYHDAGYESIITSASENRGRADLIDGLSGQVTVLAGASGVGKSSLLNELIGENRFETGQVSERLQRGRHTTRSVELVPLAGRGWIADSPGFSVLDLSGVPKERLSFMYREMARLQGRCRFSGCLHRSEPGCHVRDGVADGEIDAGRYERYLRILAELEESEARRY